MELERIVQKLQDVLAADRPVDCGRVVFFLTHHQVRGTAGPYLKSLYSVIDNTDVFRVVANRMAEDLMNYEDTEAYKSFMSFIWERFLIDNTSKHFDVGQQLRDEAFAIVPVRFMRALSALPREILARLVAYHPKDRLATALLERAVRLQEIADEVLETVLLPLEIILNIRKWWKGEISGKRCVKNILDCGLSITAGFMSGTGGAIVGGKIGCVFLGPPGLVIGAAVGGLGSAIVGAKGAHALSDLLTRNLFGLPHSRALSNAYQLLGVNPTASNSTINKAFRDLVLRNRNNSEMSVQINISMAVVREARC